MLVTGFISPRVLFSEVLKKLQSYIYLSFNNHKMGKRLYVGGLPYSTTEEELQTEFSKAGEVKSANIIRDRMNNNRSKGFGFIEMATDEGAEAAIEMWHGKELEGRKLTVNEARPMKERGQRGDY